MEFKIRYIDTKIQEFSLRYSWHFFVFNLHTKCGARTHNWRSRVLCSTSWASQAPLLPVSFARTSATLSPLLLPPWPSLRLLTLQQLPGVLQRPEGPGQQGPSVDICDCPPSWRAALPLFTFSEGKLSYDFNLLATELSQLDFLSRRSLIAVKGRAYLLSHEARKTWQLLAATFARFIDDASLQGNEADHQSEETRGRRGVVGSRSCPRTPLATYSSFGLVTSPKKFPSLP